MSLKILVFNRKYELLGVGTCGKKSYYYVLLDNKIINLIAYSIYEIVNVAFPRSSVL